jgi:myo-inositol-1(or 4)-monophosphatase
MNRYLQAAQEIARQAGDLLLDEFQKSHKFEYKGGVEIVTAADRRSEEFIVERLRTFFPPHAIIGEEGGERATESDYCWYVDPLDGTTNFAHGYPLFAVSMALVRSGEILVGVVHDPIRAETFYAVRGEGAWLNQKRIQVSATEQLSESLLATGFNAQQRNRGSNIHYYNRFNLLTHGVRRDGSAALDLCYVACGRFDGFWEFNLKSWDTAAGTLVAREAGGLVTDLKGLPYRLGDVELAASNGRIHPTMQEVFAEVSEQAARAPAS